MTRGRWKLGLISLAGVALGVLGGGTRAQADDPGAVERRERCAVRLSIALTGNGPDAALLSAPNPQAQVDTLLGSAEFVERFARFTNAFNNDKPGATAAEDATYWVARRVLETGLPWKDVYVGPFDVNTDANGNVVVVDAPNGLGYFRSLHWLKRYAGNETNGVKIVTANRILTNTVGLQLTAVTTAPGQDISATGRQAASCRGCHYDSWYALDKVAAVLTRRMGTGANITFAPPTAGPQTILDGRTIADDKDLVQALVGSPQFAFRQCRMAFNFLYGRDETSCEGKIFDACVDALNGQGTMRAAVGAIAKDGAFCD